MVIMIKSPIAIRTLEQQAQVKKMVRQLDKYRMEPNIDMVEHVRQSMKRYKASYLRDML